MLRLSEDALRTRPLNANIKIGSYPRVAAPKVVHIGVGAFHRAHQAAYFDDLNRQCPDTPWLIQGASLRSSTAADQLNPQNGLYLHIAQSAQDAKIRVIRSLVGVLNGFDNPQSLIASIASPATQLITLTITEKGYCIDTVSNALDLENPDVQADCKDLQTPRTAIGYLVAGLRLRRENNGPPITVLSCDNLSHNGRLTAQAVHTLAAIHSKALADWITQNVSFPASMVDRIAPAITHEDYTSGQHLLNLEDQALAMTEQFSQWVIEDNFAGERPPLECTGVEFVASVDAWEQRKLRLLNAAHSGLAYLGGLMDIQYVHEAVAMPALRTMLEALWQEALYTLAPDDAFDAMGYCDALLRRFANPHLNHRLYQIATDGSQKLPQRVIRPLTERLEHGLSSPTMTQILAAWLLWQWGTTFSGRRFTVNDPLAIHFSQATAGSARDDLVAIDKLVAAYAPLKALCGQSARLREDLRAAYEALAKRFTP